MSQSSKSARRNNKKNRAQQHHPDATGSASSHTATASPEVKWSVAGINNITLIPALFTLALLALSFTPRVQQHDILLYSFWAACLGLVLFQGALIARCKQHGEERSFVIALKPQHYVQAMVHTSVYIYWGYYWEPVQNHVVLLIAQIIFAYAFDMMLSWWRRENYQLGFGPFPIIFSTNLFLWFRDDWFYLQFIMVAIGFLGKEFVRWNRDGRRVHIFNPSAFTLGLFSLVLITTNTTDITWGPQIASTLTLAPNIYSYLFIAGLVVMYFFSITLVAASAAAVLFLLSAVYYAMTGVPYFLDSEIPSAVFLGLHLLITDPSTSPRTPTGKFVFGILYGIGVFVLYSLLSLFGAPTFYDKLLCVPLLNLSVQWIDRAVYPLRNVNWLEKIGLGVTPSRKANLGHMAIWILFFAGMTMLGKTDARHTGDSYPFWVQSCEEGKATACDRLILLETTYCNDGSGWACNELAANFATGRYVDQDSQQALNYFARACELKYQAGCVNLLDPTTISQTEPRVFDLRLLLREGGQNLLEAPEDDLIRRACDHGWAFACRSINQTADMNSNQVTLR